MSALTVFRVIAKEFESMSDQDVQAFIDLAKLSVNQRLYCNRYDLAVAYLTAHMIKGLGADADTSGKGPVTSEKVGDLQASYGTLAMDASDAEFGTTTYGQKFAQIKRTTFATPLVV